MNKLIIYGFIGGIALGGLFVFIRPEKPLENTPVENNMPTVKTFELVISGGKVVSGNNVIQVTEGDSVVIGITADENNEFHLHVYDKEVKLQKGIRSEISFTADKNGRFGFELHEGKIELGAIEVLPK